MATKRNLRANIADLERQNKALVATRAQMANSVADALETLGSVIDELQGVARNESVFARLSNDDRNTVRLTIGRLEDLSRSLSRENDYDSPSPLYTRSQARTGRRALNALVAAQAVVAISATLPTAIENTNSALVAVVETASDALLLAPEEDVAAQSDDAVKRVLLEILTSDGGVELWNQLRDDPALASELVPGGGLRKGDLNDPDLSGLDLSGLDLSGVNFLRADLRSTSLNQTDLRRAVLTDAYMTSLDLRTTKLTSSTLIRTRLTGSDITDVDLSEVVANDAKFDDVAAGSTSFNSAELARASFENAMLRSATFEAANVSDARFSNACLVSARFAGATVIRTQFSGSNLVGSTFLEGDIGDAAFVEQADVSGADLRASTTSRVRFDDVLSDGETLWPEGHGPD